jgi:hypothetical protein
MALLKYINQDDLKIYIDDSINKYGYNLGDFLNAPFYMGLWKQNPHNDDELLNRLYNMAKHYPETILGLYCKDRPNDELVPNIPRLKLVTNLFLKNNIDRITCYNDIINPDNLCVHIRVGDYGIVSNYFINIIYQLSLKYKKVILFTGIHADQTWNKIDVSKNNCITSINAILSKNTNIYVYLDNPDVHLSLFSVAQNLLLHRNGFSILASLVCTGNMYVTREFSPIMNNDWRHAMVNKNIVLLS